MLHMSKISKKKMSSKKLKTIQPRPEPPDLDSVRSDLENALTDDVTFTFFQFISKDDDLNSTGPRSDSNFPQTTDRNIESNKDFIKSSARASGMESSSPSVPSPSSRKTKQPDLDQCYSQTLRFIEMNDYLKDSQDRLAEQCNELQELGKTVAEQVESLRTQLSS